MFSTAELRGEPVGEIENIALTDARRSTPRQLRDLAVAAGSRRRPLRALGQPVDGVLDGAPRRGWRAVRSVRTP
jgi:hypothetical protein